MIIEIFEEADVENINRVKTQNIKCINKKDMKITKLPALSEYHQEKHVILSKSI